VKLTPFSQGRVASSNFCREHAKAIHVWIASYHSSQSSSTSLSISQTFSYTPAGIPGTNCVTQTSSNAMDRLDYSRRSNLVFSVKSRNTYCSSTVDSTDAMEHTQSNTATRTEELENGYSVSGIFAILIRLGGHASKLS
jgi:hypothetical protein